MNAWFNTFGFYTVDTSYMKLLNSIDSEVYYSNDPSYARKPFLGIVVAIGGYRCFIPLTSAKKRHEKWKRIDKSHFLVYETIDAKGVSKTDVIQRIPGDATHVYKILAALDIKKMIPVLEKLYSKVDFEEEAKSDPDYANLLRKEFRFLKKYKQDILARVEKTYIDQKAYKTSPSVAL